MGLPPPKLRDLTEWSVGTSAVEQKHPYEIWEIGTPEKRSLPWSIILSYLYIESMDLKQHLSKITGTDEEVNEIKNKKNLSEEEITVENVNKELSSFNPFKNRHASFIQKKVLTKLFRIFDLRLKRFSSQLKGENDEWNDDLKLNAASKLLKCKIEVYFPDQSENQTFVSYPKVPQKKIQKCKFKKKIVLFQYKNQQHESSKKDFFHFGMTVQEVHKLKIDALVHFLKKAKISSDYIGKVKDLMGTPDNHGKSFLRIILQNGLGDILEEIYKSSYIALKLSEAGFETNPTSTRTQDLSPFSYAVLFGENSKNFRILYDYASNCCCLFDHSVRTANDKVLETLKEIKDKLERDLSILTTPVCSVDLSFKDGNCTLTVNILKQFILFIEYHIKASSDLKALKEKFESSALKNYEFWKQVIQLILTHYASQFYNDSKQQFSDIADEFINYFQFSEYYESLDYFAFISFFDNFYSLRRCMKLKQENYTKIESRMFIAIISNSHYSKCGKRIKCDSLDEKKKCQYDNALRYIPLFYRKVLLNEIGTFLEIIENISDSTILQNSPDVWRKENDSNVFSQVTDELSTLRLNKHIQAALEVSVFDDGIKAILVIERALQIIGESIKPLSLVSFLLKSCLSKNLQHKLFSIRNNLSHTQTNSICRRLEVEKNFSYFNSIQKELADLKKCFEIAIVTQFSMTEESMMLNCIEQIGRELDPDVKATLEAECTLRMDKYVKAYLKPQNKLVELLLRTISDIEDHVKSTEKRAFESKEFIFSHIKAVQHLLQFILRHINDTILANLKEDFDDFIIKFNNTELDIFMSDLDALLTKSINELLQYNTEPYAPVSVPAIESLYNSLKEIDSFSADESEQITHVMQYAYEQATEAKITLQKMCDLQYKESQGVEECLEKILSPLSKVNDIKHFLKSENPKEALALFQKSHYSKTQLEEDINCFLKKTDDKKGLSSYFITLLTKITYQRYLKYPIYISIVLSENIFKKLENSFTKRVRFLITRIQVLKCVLIEEDEEVKETWIWGRSKAIKYHMKFLMRQRYIKDDIVRASLDMAFFDCANMLMKSSFKELYEKSVDLFSGINLRNLLAHRANIPEAIGEILDESDFPSTMIDKMLFLIDDLEALESILELFPVAGFLQVEDFVNWIQSITDERYEKQIKAINDCERWKDYLFLFPFLRN